MGRSGRIAVFVTICAAAFGSGIFAGYVRSRPSDVKIEAAGENMSVEAKEEESYVKEVTSYMTVTPETVVSYYEVRSEGDYVVAYEVYTDGERAEIERAEADMSMLRREDRALLESGIKVESREDAVGTLEDFVS